MASVVTTIRPIDILIVCTGNICRSPMAEALLRAQVADRGVDASVSSVGTTAAGYPASESAVKVMRDLDLDISEHVSRVLTPEILAGSDLVLAMAREHVREVVVLDPSVFARTFTLKELVRRGGELGGRTSDESVGAWLTRMHQGRIPILHLGASPADDVADPIGQRMAVYERTADELAELIDHLAALLWQDATLLTPTRAPEHP